MSINDPVGSLGSIEQLSMISNSPFKTHFPFPSTWHRQKKKLLASSLLSIISQATMHHLYASLLLTLYTISAPTLALPTPPTSPAITFAQALRADLHCGMIACPGGNSRGHAFCQNIGCDYCVIVASSPPLTHYECDGLRRAPAETSLVSVGKWNGTIADARRYPNGVGIDE